VPESLYACIHQLSCTGGGAPPPPRTDADASLRLHRQADSPLTAIAREFSPRFEHHGDDLVVIDVSGLTRLLGPAPIIGDELRRAVGGRGLRAHVAVASTRTAAMILAIARPGLTIVPSGAQADAVAPVAIGILEKLEVRSVKSEFGNLQTSDFTLQTFLSWGLRTLGDLAALPAADLVARTGKPSLVWQAIARGDDIHPLVPALDEERFDAAMELEWPIEGLEPLSFVLTRLLEPLSTRLERRDRGAVVMHVLLRLVDKTTCVRRLELLSPMREVRALRTLALLDLEAHPPGAAIDRVAIAIDPTPGRVLQHTLFTRAVPTPEQLSTLVARLGALMGQDRIGRAVMLDTDRPGAFAMAPFRTDQEGAGRAGGVPPIQPPSIVSALRRCRQPVPARVAVADGRPVRVTTDRRGFAGGAVVQCAGPWRTSGNWWAGEPIPPVQPSWNRDEWDVALADGAVYRVFQDRDTNAWFIDGIVD